MRVFSDIEYTPGLAPDVYVPSVPAAGAIMLFHGGGWVTGSKKDDAELASLLSAENFVVFAVEYGSQPGTSYLASLRNTLTAFKWVLSSPFVFDRNKVAVWGCFSGGSLAVDIAASTGIPAVAWSPVLDAKGYLDETATMGDRDYDYDFSGVTLKEMNEYGRDDRLLRWAILQSIMNNVSVLSEATVLNRVGPTSGPVMVVNSMDELVPPAGALLYQQAMTAAMVPTEVLILPGQRHGYGLADPAMDPSLAFVRRALRLYSQPESEGKDETALHADSNPAPISSFKRAAKKRSMRSSARGQTIRTVQTAESPQEQPPAYATSAVATLSQLHLVQPFDFVLDLGASGFQSP